MLSKFLKGSSWSCLYGSWICNNLCNQCPSPLMWVSIHSWQGKLDTTLCDKGWQWLAAGRWFSLDTLVSSTNKTDHHNIIEILLKMALKTITLTQILNDTLQLNLVISNFTGPLKNFELSEIRLKRSEGFSKIGNSVK